MRHLKIGGHVVFIDEHRRNRDALVTAIHGDPDGRPMTWPRKPANELTEEEKASGKWRVDTHMPPIYAYQVDENGEDVIEYGEPGTEWPCINLVVVSDNEDAQDQYGRQIDERYSSVTHWEGNTAHGYCYRFADEVVEEHVPKTIS